ncbi:MAG: hypothetical protein QNK37_38275 [Acidobacteriota bacterium]|nr:hypothetical protein [Acidobacteriota bacterium]
MRKDFSDFFKFIHETGGFLDAPLIAKFYSLELSTAKTYLSKFKTMGKVIPSPYEYDERYPKIFCLPYTYYIENHLYPTRVNHLITIQHLIGAHFALDLMEKFDMELEDGQYGFRSKMDEVVLFEKNTKDICLIFVPTHSPQIYAEFEYFYHFHRQVIETGKGIILVAVDPDTDEFFRTHPISHKTKFDLDLEVTNQVLRFQVNYWEDYKHYLYKNVPHTLSLFRKEVGPDDMERFFGVFLGEFI